VVVLIIVVVFTATIIWLLFQTLHLFPATGNGVQAGFQLRGKGVLVHNFCKGRGDDNQDNDGNNENIRDW